MACLGLTQGSRYGKKTGKSEYHAQLFGRSLYTSTQNKPWKVEISKTLANKHDIALYNACDVQYVPISLCQQLYMSLHTFCTFNCLANEQHIGSKGKQYF